MSESRDTKSAPGRRFWWWLVDNRHFLVAALLLLPAVHFVGLLVARERFPVLEQLTLIRTPNSWAPMLVVIWLGFFGYFLFRGWESRRRSRLNRRRQSALHLKVEERRHLRGRDDDIAFYKKLCREHRLIFLKGESGSGKSAFLAAGLYQDLRTAPGELLLPILIDSWGDDWETGPFLQLAQAITREMTPALYQATGYKEPISYTDVKEVLIALRQRANRVPLLLFDQFDDYQARHLDKFVVNGRSINDKELSEQNQFWREIGDLVVTDRVHCLFALRTDNRAGIVAVQFFHRPEEHYLSRLAGHYVAPLLEEMTSAAPGEEPVIFEPEYGWQILRSRLIKDLGPDGLVLPVQLKMALRALEQLPFLTVTEYQRVGGLLGLERTHVGFSIRTAARVAELPERTLAMLLHCLIDPQHEPRKTRALTLDELLAAAQAQGLDVPSEKLERALQHLIAKDLVRRPLATEPVPRWRLDHDYLCRAVEEVVRGFDPGLERATEWHQAYQTASGWRRLREAVRIPAGNLFWASLRGRISDRSAASFVRTRGLGWIAVFLAAVVGASSLLYAQRQETTARALLDSSDYFALSRASEAVRHKYVDLALDDEKHASTLIKDRSTLRALIGIDPARRAALVEQVLDSCPMLDLTKLRLAGQHSWRKQHFCILMMYALATTPEKAFNSDEDVFQWITDLTISRAREELGCKTDDPRDRQIADIINTLRLDSPNKEVISNYGTMIYYLISLRHNCFKRSWLAALQSINKNKELVFNKTQTPPKDHIISRLVNTWDNKPDSLSKEEIETANNNIKEYFQYFSEKTSPEAARSYLSSLLRIPDKGSFERFDIDFFKSAGAVVLLRPLLARIPKADAVTTTQKSFQQLLKLPDTSPVHRDLLELFVSQWEQADVVATFDELVKKLDQADTEVAYPVNLATSLSALIARLDEGARVPAVRKLVAVLTRRCAEEAHFRRVKFQKYALLTKLMSELAQRLTDAEGAGFVQAWWQLYVSEQGAIHLSTERPPMTPQEVIYDKSESESLRSENIESIWVDSPLRAKLPAYAATLKPSVSEVIAGLMQKVRMQPDGVPSLRYYYERRIHFLGNLVPAAQRGAVHQSLVASLGRPSLNTAKGYDALTRTLCSNIRHVIIDSYDHMEAIRRQYNPFSIPCLTDISEADARFILFDFLSKSAFNKLLEVRPDDEALSTLITAARCGQAGCLEQIFRIMQQSSYAVQRGTDVEAPNSAGLSWQKSWSAVLKPLSQGTALDFLEARIAALPDPKGQALDRVSAFTYDRDIGLLLGLLRAAPGDPSARPRIADFCAAQVRVPDWHANSRKVFLRCLGAERARSLLEELYGALMQTRGLVSRQLTDQADVILRHLEPLPANRHWMQRYIDLLKSIRSDDSLRNVLLTRIEKLTGQQFQEDEFKLAEWAKAQGYDVTTPIP